MIAASEPVGGHVVSADWASVDWGSVLRPAPSGDTFVASLLRECLQHAPLGIAILDQDERTLFSNETMAALSGVTAAQAVGRRAVDLAPELHGAARHVVQNVLDRGQPVRGYPLQSRDPVAPTRMREWEADYAPLVRDGEVAAVAAVLRDVTEERRAAREALAWRERYEAVVRASGQLLFDWEFGGDAVQCSGEAEQVTGFSAGALSGTMDRWLQRLVHAEDREALTAELAQARSTGAALDSRFRIVRADGKAVWVACRGQCARDGDGRPVRLLGLVSGAAAPEKIEDQDLLLREMNHRVKNTLAVVQSIARRTLHGIPGADAALDAFNGRLHALAAVHSLLTDAQWRGAQLDALIAAQAAPYAGDRVQLNGPEVRLEANMAQTFALVIHELAVNAAKYGALSLPAGFVETRWNVEDGWLRLVWEEHDGPAIEAPPERRGFGSTLIRTIVERSQGGHVRFDFRREGLRCMVDLPLAAGPGTAG